MSDSKHDPNRYAVTLSDGRTYTYAADGQERFPWRIGHDMYNAHICRTPADYRACAEVVERWEADHAPVPAPPKRTTEHRVAELARLIHDTSVCAIKAREGVSLADTTTRLHEIKKASFALWQEADLAARPDEEYTDE